MEQDERNRIEFSLDCKMSVADIAKALGRSKSTISCELLNRHIDSDKHYRCSNRLCATTTENQISRYALRSFIGNQINLKFQQDYQFAALEHEASNPTSFDLVHTILWTSPQDRLD